MIFHWKASTHANTTEVSLAVVFIILLVLNIFNTAIRPFPNEVFPSDNQHGIAKAVEAVSLGNRLLIGLGNHILTGKGSNQHKQG